MGNCDHKFIDSLHCLKCGWVPPSKPTPAEPELTADDESPANMTEDHVLDELRMPKSMYSPAVARATLREYVAQQNRTFVKRLCDRVRLYDPHRCQSDWEKGYDACLENIERKAREDG